MNRRRFLNTAAAGVATAYVWIPKISIAQMKGDAREAIIKARTVVASNWELISKGSSETVAKNGQYTSAIHTATSKMKTRQYVDFTSRGTEYSRSQSGLAMFGGHHSNGRDHCNHYFAKGQERPLAYVSTIPFLMKSYILETTIKEITVSRSINFLYPVVAVEYFEAYLGQEAALQTPPPPLRVGCAEGFWICEYSFASVRAGHGTISIWSNDVRIRTVIYKQAFEFDFA
jgi:hypothetical protein